MGRTLQPEDRISHYRVVGPLGAGGMGEVYIAQDETLERSVALKTLPPHLVRNEERVRRFITEAKSASSLNHPNIVTIYEIGRDEVKPGGSGERREGDASSDSGSSPIHFIAMELVAGETLSQKIHHEKTDLRALLGHIAQAAEGVAKAHAAGIVHRDLKPGNIMVSRDGYTKVLDFGLAKLTEKQPVAGAPVTNAPTEAAATSEGAVMGTVGYMSPEQVQGKPADHRSDIFSMGCVLYEAATRRRPFVADTDVEIMHKILRERPAPVEEINPEVPSEVRRLVRRCLAKNPDERLQSMRDLAIELREIVDEYDALSAATTSGSTMASRALGVPPPKRGGFSAAIAAVVVLGLAGLAFGLYSLLWKGGGGAPAGAGMPQLQINALMSRNDLEESALSRDGRYLAFVTSAQAKWSLYVRQVRTGSDAQILPPQDTPIIGISFSPDGDYLYFLNRDPNLASYRALFRVASLGGAPRKLIFDIDSAASFSPDGTRACFRRGFPQNGEDTLQIATLETGQERELIRIKTPEIFGGTDEAYAPPAWSPDGKRIAVGVFDTSKGARSSVVSIDAETGARQVVAKESFVIVDSLGWLPDNSGILASAFVLGTNGFQIYHVPYPQGDVHRLTNDLDGYNNISISADGKSIAAVRRTGVTNIWTASPDAGREARAITAAAGGTTSIDKVIPLADGGVVFTAPAGNKVFVWRAEGDGSGRRQLTTQGVYVLSLKYVPAAGIVFSQVEEDRTVHIWRIDPDGGGLRQLTRGQSEDLYDVSPDGTSALSVMTLVPDALYLLSLAGGEPVRLVKDANSRFARFSPDGKSIMCSTFVTRGDRIYTAVQVIPAAGGAPIATITPPPGATDWAWAPGSKAMTYIDRGTGYNVMRQDLAGGPPVQLTRFTEGQAASHVWSHEGTTLSVRRRIGDQQSLWTLRPGAGEPRRVAGFSVGRIQDQFWSPDDKRLVFTYATANQDVVLITDFK